jgi:hypothetical protein
MMRDTQVNKSADFGVSDRDSIPGMGLTLRSHRHRHVGFWLQIRDLFPRIDCLEFIG